MLKSCKYCGRIHDTKYDCGKKPVRKKIRTQQNRFRSTIPWKNKSTEIRERDCYLCQICIRNLYETRQQYNNQKIEVHHIVPISESWNKRLDNYNLLALCEEHHKAAENGRIPRDVLLSIAKTQEEKLRIPPVSEGQF